MQRGSSSAKPRPAVHVLHVFNVAVATKLRTRFANLLGIVVPATTFVVRLAIIAIWSALLLVEELISASLATRAVPSLPSTVHAVQSNPDISSSNTPNNQPPPAYEPFLPATARVSPASQLNPCLNHHPGKWMTRIRINNNIYLPLTQLPVHLRQQFQLAHQIDFFG